MGVRVNTPPAHMLFADRGGRETKVSFGVADHADYVVLGNKSLSPPETGARS